MSRGVLKKREKAYKELAIYVGILILLTITALNLAQYLSPKKVLGAQTQSQSDSSSENQTFWTNFLEKNPDYIPGQIEVGNLNTVKKIDPNYLIR